jgi:hypothetical protein
LIGSLWFNSFSAGGGGAASDYELIATSFGTGSSGSVTFSSIPAGYKHLQLRFTAIATAGNPYMGIRLNGDSGTNYAYHYLMGTGSSVLGNGATGQTSAINLGFIAGINTSIPTAGIADIADAFSTNKNKTIRTLNGNTGELVLSSGLWINTNAVTSVNAFLQSGSFTTSSRFSLYGLKG